jgi:hypothetical protein
VKPSEARKQKGRSRLIHPSSWKSFVDGSSGMPRLTLGEYRLDRLSLGEQTGRVCRESAAVSSPANPVGKENSMAVIDANWSVASVSTVWHERYSRVQAAACQGHNRP